MIKVCEPLLNGNEIQYVMDCIKTNWISSRGKYIDNFEHEFANYCGCKYGITTTSGTTALHLALKSLDIGFPDEVIVPSFTMAASVFAIIYSGAKPVLVDSEWETGNIDVKKIEEKITHHTKAIMPVHIYGQVCDMNPIMDIALKYGLYIIEDAAEAHGAKYNDKISGGIGDVGCFSFYANKIITCGEGGMVVTNDDNIADKAKLLKDLAHSKKERFLHTEIAYNYRMSNVQAAIGLAQLEKIEELVNMRRNHAHLYNQLLQDNAGVRTPIQKLETRNVYWMYTIKIKDDFGMTAKELRQKLYENNIETRAFFIPMHRQPAFLNIGLFKNEEYPVADELSERGIILPSGSGLTDEEIHYICKTINSFRKN